MRSAGRPRWALFAAGISALPILAGCAPLTRNQSLTTFDPNGGYRFDNLPPGDNNTDSLFICLTFSGGGTRAAALAYGALLQLRDTMIPCPSDPSRSISLLDEVDLISGVSGGSFTAMAYGLWGERALDGRWAKSFLHHDIEWSLLTSILWPKNILGLPFVVLDRIDVAAAYYDDAIFDRATYQDLLSRKRRPFIVVNATNLSTGRRFEFTQDDFDILGSDLATLPVGWATAASSAFPILLSPLRLKYFHGPAATQAVHRVLEGPKAPTEDERRFRWAESLVASSDSASPAGRPLDAKAHRFCYLMDGGLSDNLGLSAVIQSYRYGAICERLAAGKIAKLAVIVVNAGNNPPEDIETRDSSPGLYTVGYKTAAAGIDNHSARMTEMIRLLLVDSRQTVQDVQQRYQSALKAHCPDAPELKPIDEFEAYVPQIAFNNIVDQRERERFLSIPTRFTLPAADVDALIGIGRRLLSEHPEFERLLADLRGAAPTE